MQNLQNRCPYTHGLTIQTSLHPLLEGKKHVITAHPCFLYNNPAYSDAGTMPCLPHTPFQIYALDGSLLYAKAGTISS